MRMTEDGQGVGAVSRRGFLGGAAAFFVAGCRTRAWFGAPDLAFGVVSDLHITTPASCALFETALRYFRRRGADAVMVPGDLTDYGHRSGLEYVKAAWDRTFAGTGVVPLFCTGNHDWEGWRYGDMAADMRANGYSTREAMDKLGLKGEWERIMGEPFAPIRVRTVKGYDFVSAEWTGFKDLPKWMAENGGRFKGTKPFFLFQHPPAHGTTPDGGSKSWDDAGAAVAALKGLPNAVVFTGHSHRSFNDERSIWQGAFTAIATPSLSYTSPPPGHENGNAARNGSATNAMPYVTWRRDLRGGEGYFVSVYAGRMVVERIDFTEDCTEGAPAWIVPLDGTRPYDAAVRAAASVAPEFPAGAELHTETRNTETRQGKWAIVVDCTFPAAAPAAGRRVFDYELRIVPQNGAAPVSVKFLSPAYAMTARHEPRTMRFWFDAAKLPKDADSIIEARAYDCFGKASRPLVSRRVWHPCAT